MTKIMVSIDILVTRFMDILGYIEKYQWIFWYKIYKILRKKMKKLIQNNCYSQIIVVEFPCIGEISTFLTMLTT